MKFLDKYFIRKQNDKYCFRYSKKYLKKLEKEKNWDKIDRIMRYLDYPWSLKVFKLLQRTRKVASKGKASFSIVAYIKYCRLGNLKPFQYRDSQMWEDMLI
jgi:hypothetical protein